jgi:hypothetical protein
MFKYVFRKSCLLLHNVKTKFGRARQAIDVYNAAEKYSLCLPDENYANNTDRPHIHTHTLHF